MQKDFAVLTKSLKAAGKAPTSLVQDLLGIEDVGSPDLEHQIKWSTGALYGGMFVSENSPMPHGSSVHMENKLSVAFG